MIHFGARTPLVQDQQYPGKFRLKNPADASQILLEVNRLAGKDVFTPQAYVDLVTLNGDYNTRPPIGSVADVAIVGSKCRKISGLVQSADDVYQTDGDKYILLTGEDYPASMVPLQALGRRTL